MTQQKEVSASQEQRDRVAGHLSLKVIGALGPMAGRTEVQVRWLWEDHYRVNVMDASGEYPIITHSYFLRVDSQGEVLESSPAMLARG